MKPPLQNSSLSQQLALVAAGLCLVVSLALVALAAISSRHMQMQQQQEYGTALAQQIARRIGTAMESGDLLSIAASLQRFVASTAAAQVEIFDVEGKALAQAGNAVGEHLNRYEEPVRIEADTAGKVVITISSELAHAAHLRFVLSLLGLAVLLSLAVYGASRHLGQRLGDRLADLARVLALEDSTDPTAPANEVSVLASRVHALPMELLRARGQPDSRDENYRKTAVLYLHLSSLVNYVDTLDEQSLHRYTERLHQVVLAAAGFYGGELQVARQFGLAVYFSGHNNAGSPAFRAASCAWLVQAVSAKLEQQMPLSMAIAMAIAQSELGAGDEADIYPGLYMQHTLDELEEICARKPPRPLLARAICEDADIAGRLQFRATKAEGFAMLDDFAGAYRDLLERQLRLILKRLADPATRR